MDRVVIHDSLTEENRHSHRHHHRHHLQHHRQHHHDASTYSPSSSSRRSSSCPPTSLLLLNSFILRISVKILAFTFPSFAIKTTKKEGAEKGELPKNQRLGASPIDIRLSFSEALQSTVKASIGAGVLALPHAMQLAGCVFGPALMLLIALYTMHVNLLLVECHRMVVFTDTAATSNTHRPEPSPSSYAQTTFSGLCEAVLGRPGKIVGAVNLLLMQVFACAAFFTFVGRNLTAAMHSWGFEIVDFRTVVILFGILASGSTLLTDIGFLKTTFIFGNIAVLISLITIMTYAIPSFSFENLPVETTLPQLTVFFSMSVYTFNGIGEVLPISSSMEDTAKYPKVLACSIGMLYLVYLVFALAVSGSFGGKTQGMVFDNLEGPVVAFVKIFHSLAVLCTIPLKYFSGIKDGLVPLLDMMLGPRECVGTSVDQVNCSLNATIRLGTRLATVVVSVATALLVPDFAFLVALIGGFCVTIVAFILPPLMFFVLSLDPRHKFSALRQLLNGLILALGVCICVVLTTKNLKDKFFT